MVVMVAAPLAGLAVWTRSFLLLAGLVVAVLAIIALGVKIPQLSLFGRYVCWGPGTRRCVALTFDDGPDARSTPALLDLLRDAKVSATFFCIGKNVAEHQDLVARMTREGHLVENHSYFHNYATNIFTVARLREELTRAQVEIQKATGAAPRFFRPPMGLTNPRIFKAARAVGLTVIGWTARGFDTRLTDPDRIVARIVRKLRPGAIILLHDGNIPADRLLTTVKTLLDTLRALNYEVVRLDQALK